MQPIGCGVNRQCQVPYNSDENQNGDIFPFEIKNNQVQQREAPENYRIEPVINFLEQKVITLFKPILKIDADWLPQ